MRSDDPRLLTREAHRLPGLRRIQPAAATAAGADWQVTVPGGRMWRILLGQAHFVASAAAGNRTPALVIAADGVQVWQSITLATLAANAVQDLTLQLSDSVLTAAPALARFPVPIPGVWLPPGATFGSLTGGILAADQWSAVNLYLEEAFFDEHRLSQEHVERSEELRDELRAAGILPGAGY